LVHNVNDYMPGAFEYVYEFVEIIINNKIHAILNKLLGEKYYYNGSDAKIYFNDTNWHCDRKVSNTHLKVVLYLSDLNENNVCLRVIPGSHHYGDKINSILSKKAIPLFQGPGGFQNNFFQFKDKDVPCFPIKNKYGDLVIFNLGLYHSAFGNHINKKMVCMNYASSYEDINDSEKLECINGDFGINLLRKNIDFNKKLLPVASTFYDFIKTYDNYYNKYIKEYVENDNLLDKYMRIQSFQQDKSEIQEFINNCKNTNNKKTSNTIVVSNNYSV